VFQLRCLRSLRQHRHCLRHRHPFTGRNADCFNVLGKISFDVGEEAVREVIRNGSMPQWASGSLAVGIADHDIVFWLGDLNYRIDESMPTEKILELSERQQLDDLRMLDQLNLERKEGRAFVGVVEGVINFVPTCVERTSTNNAPKRNCGHRRGVIRSCGWRKNRNMCNN
jgi:phosphatidylinositol-bisphosphatase